MKIKPVWNPVHYSYFLLQQFRFRKEPSTRLKLLSGLLSRDSKTELEMGASKLMLLASLLMISLVGCGNFRGQQATAPADSQSSPQRQAEAGNGENGDIQAAAQSAPADNTALNKRDRDGATLTPTDQSEKETDRLLTQQIRKALVSDETLSTAAKNVKIITVDGMVTLRGPVETEEEKRLITQKAQQQAGTGKVNSQIEVIQPVR